MDNNSERYKPIINMLPCSIPIKWFFWTTIILFYGVNILQLYIAKNTKSFWGVLDHESFVEYSIILLFFSFLATLSGLIFTTSFAKGCHKLPNNESTYIYWITLLPISLFIMSLALCVDKAGIVLKITACLMQFISFVMIILLSKDLRNHYSGKLGLLGKLLWRLVKVQIYIIIALGMVFALTIPTLIYDDISANLMISLEIYSIISHCLIICIVIYNFILTISSLWRITRLLDAGFENNFSDRDLELCLQGQIPQETPFPQAYQTPYNPIQYATPPVYAGPPPFNPNTPIRKNPDLWNRLSTGGKILSIIGLALAVAFIVFLISIVVQVIKQPHKDEYEEPTELYDYDYEEAHEEIVSEPEVTREYPAAKPVEEYYYTYSSDSCIDIYTCDSAN